MDGELKPLGVGVVKSKNKKPVICAKPETEWSNHEQAEVLMATSF